MDELDEIIYSEIKSLCAKGDECVENGKFDSALSNYWKAFDLVPDPKTNWEASTWILTAIGDTNFFKCDFQEGVDNLNQAMFCPEAIGNPFIHLRLGQCLLEVGNLDKAADELTRAYALEGEEIFSNDSPKYLKFLKSKIKTDSPNKKPWWKI